MGEPLIFHYAHVILGSIWLGFLVGGLAYSRLSADRIVEYHSNFGLIALLALLLQGVVGILLAGNYGSVGEWFMFGTFTGRIGEKIILYLLLLAIGGYLQHSLVPRLGRGEASITAYRAVIALLILLSLGAMLLGTMITEGVE